MEPLHTIEPGILGIDIGGANLKYATVDGRCLERVFPMWTQWQRLGQQLQEDIESFGRVGTVAITMTGELADCFDSRREGVRHIVDCVERTVGRFGQRSLYYATDGQFYLADQAIENWQHVAASNWHALAKCVGLEIASDSLLIDIGSTTTDVIAISDGQVVTDAKTDMQRLRDCSLVYVGCRRTPVQALVASYRFRDCEVPVMNEMFATIDDARLWLGAQEESKQDHGTADQKPRDRHHAKARLVRMIGLDYDEVSNQETDQIARQICVAASTRITEASSRWSECENGSESRKEVGSTWVLSGHGQDLVEVPETVTAIDLRSRLPKGVSRVAPAWAVARLKMQH